SWPGRSLSPGDGPSRGVDEVVALLVPTGPGRDEAELRAALRAIEAAAAAAFPGNIFWDLELLAASLLRSGEIAAQGRQIAELQALYGETTAIRFRYVHDFLYGYDWAKWVQREPASRK